MTDEEMLEEKMTEMAKNEFYEMEHNRSDFSAVQNIANLCMVRYVRKLEAEIEDLNTTISHLRSQKK